jgi:hypothetical protein
MKSKSCLIGNGSETSSDMTEIGRTTGLLKRFLGWLSNRDSLLSDYERWPRRGNEEQWMRGKVAHYRKHFPERAYILFDISSGDYLPLTIHASSSFGKGELAAYRRIKNENVDLVQKAKASDGHLYNRSRIYDPQDRPERDMLP